MNALGKTMVMHHPVHAQVFHRNHTEAVYDLSAFLVREIITLEGDTLMDTSNRFTMLTPFWGAFCQSGVLALYSCQCLLFLAKEMRVSDLFTGRERRKGFESNVNAYLGRHIWQAFWFALNRKASIPLARTALVDSERFDLAAYRTVIDHFDAPHFGQRDAPVMRERKARLWEREAIITVTTSKTRIAWGFTSTQPSEESFEGQIDTDRNMLQDLRMYSIQGWPFLFQYRECGLLSIKRETETRLLICFLALFQQMVIEPTTLFKGFIELPFLFLRWIYPVLKHFTHVPIIAQTVVLSSIEPNAERGHSSPCVNAGAFWPLFGNRKNSGTPCGCQIIIVPEHHSGRPA